MEMLGNRNRIFFRKVVSILALAVSTDTVVKTLSAIHSERS